MKQQSKGFTLNKTTLVTALLLELSTGVNAAVINVDGTNCTLADAITSANDDVASGGCNQGSGDDEIVLDVSNSPFVLTAKLPSIESNVTIEGNGSVVMRDSNADDFGILSIYDSYSYSNTPNHVTINNLIVSGGRSEGKYMDLTGAGILVVNATVDINNSTVSDNNGGVIFRRRTATCCQKNNLSTINNSSISNNTGSSFAMYNGAGVTLVGGNLDINNSTISNNSNLSSIEGGGGILITTYFYSVLNVSNSTISGNTSVNPGGGINSTNLLYDPLVNLLEVNIVNTTITQNSSQSTGGGIYDLNTDINVSQSIITGNTASSVSQWQSGGYSQVTVNNFNLFGSDSDSGLSGITPGNTDVIPTESIAGIIDLNLSENGGQSLTHALNPFGPAVDAIPAIFCSLMTDQTGKLRPIDGNDDGTADCDVGAFENLEFDFDPIFKNGFEGS